MPRGLVQGRAVWGTVSLAGNIVPVACGYNHKIPWLGYCGGIPNDADHVLMSGGKVTDTSPNTWPWYVGEWAGTITSGQEVVHTVGMAQ